MVKKLIDLQQAVANAKTDQDMRDAMKILKERRHLFMEKSKKNNNRTNKEQF